MIVLLSGERLHVSDRPVGLWQAIDITERKRIELELKAHRGDLELLVAERTQMLERSMSQLADSERLASVGTLAAGMAHQINNPIGAILLSTQFALLADGEPDEREVSIETLHRIEEEAARCGRILQFSRDDPKERSVADLGEVVRRAERATSGYAAKSKSLVEIGAPSGPIEVSMNPIEIEQVVVNLIQNAMESRTTGARVDILVDGDDKTAWVIVRDNGRGIPPDNAKRLFAPFFTARLAEGGTGLGLSVAHGMMFSRNGSIRVASSTQSGSVMRIDLPRVAAAPSA